MPQKLNSAIAVIGIFLRAELPGILAKRTDILSPRMLHIIEGLVDDWHRLDEHRSADRRDWRYKSPNVSRALVCLLPPAADIPAACLGRHVPWTEELAVSISQFIRERVVAGTRRLSTILTLN